MEATYRGRFAAVSLLTLGVVVFGTPRDASARHARQQVSDSTSTQMAALPASDAEARGDMSTQSHRLVEAGVAVELTLSAAAAGNEGSGAIVAGEDLDVRIALRDSASGIPVTAAVIGAWIDRRYGSAPLEPNACVEKVQGYVRGTLQARPSADLNSYFVLALNNGNNISVIDPFLGFGSSKLYTTVVLKGVGEDWALDAPRDQFFVTMPLINQVAVVSTVNWKVQKNLDVGIKPTRIVLQPDGRYAWVANEGVGGGASGVVVIDAATAEVVAEISTGDGPHAFEFLTGAAAGLSDDGQETRLAFVTNAASGTVSVIDVRHFTKVADIATGPRPVDVAYSAVGRAVYVVHEGDGSILAIDAQTTQLQARIGSTAGVTAIGFDHLGRWGFVVNNAEDEVYIIDASTATVRHALPVPDGPDQVSFTRNFAYIRSTGSVDVTMVPLNGLESEGEVAMQLFPTGQLPPGEFGDLGTATAIMSAALPSPLPRSHPRAMSGHNVDAVYVPNPADKSIYYYHYMEGMPTPSGRLHNYGFEPKAVLVVGHNLRETELGVYTTTVIAPPEGEYDVVFLLDEPRIIHCFGFAIAENPEHKNQTPLALRLEPLWGDSTFAAGDTLDLRFRLTEVGSGEVEVGVEDAWLMVYSPTGWRTRQRVTHVGDGVYTAQLTVPKPGTYLMLIRSRALGARPERQVPAALRIVSKGEER